MRPAILLVVALVLYHNSVETANDTPGSSHRRSWHLNTKSHVKSCKIVLNELYLGDDSQSPRNQFIELKRHCPPGAIPPKSKKLVGYSIAIIKLDEEPQPKLFANLKAESFSTVTNEATNEPSYLHVIGTKNTPFVQMIFNDVLVHQEGYLLVNQPVQYTSFPDAYNVIPIESETPYAVLLLKFTHKEQKEGLNDRLFMGFMTENGIRKYVPQPLTETVKEVIIGRVKDFLIYGKTSTNHAEQLMRELLEDNDFNLSDHLLTMGDREATSYSRCDYENQKWTQYQFLQQSPLSDNDCKPDYVPPFNFQGVAFQSTAQKMALNLLHYLETKARNPTKFLKDDVDAPAVVASRMLGVSRTTLFGFKKNERTCDIKTPSRKRHRRFWRQEQIDSFDRDTVRAIIAQFYKDNSAPILDEIYEKFMNYKRDNCVSYTTSRAAAAPSRFLPLCTPHPQRDIEMENAEEQEVADNERECTRHTVNLNEGFSCSKRTFAKVLRGMGFYYGRLDKRIALLQRQDIVAKRGHFLTVLRRNEEKGEEAMKVTFLDETWIDPHQTSVKGWRIKKPRTIKECAKYSYRRLKQGHGPRVIVLLAASEDEIIKSSVRVYKVTKNPNALDYHENVNRQGFLQWFGELLDEYDRRREKHIIVVDNAPYHSSQKSPKQSDRKQVLMDWLQNIRDNPNYKVQIPLSPTMRKCDLWKLVQDLKKKPELTREIYELDELAAARGHIILRLPPYQCCFNPVEFLWNVAKYRIAKQNVRQNLDEIMRIAREVLTEYDSLKWKGHVRHCKNLREKYWEEDGWMDVEIPDIIIPLENDEEDECDDMLNCGEDDCDECEDGDWPDEFDPDELQQRWQQEKDEVTTFHQLPDPVYGSIPRVRARRLFCDEDIEISD